ncbi:Tetraspanin-8 [Sesamum alatum]|uniref:Tetraspanin-8 n=1 Tax=Sesamum alatum TaxID=300844 RepID=A0AAE2CLU0_9LAMI|nr:Tetraspanin-8 [Sesamum alatum]
MVRISNGIITLLNLLTLVVGFAALLMSAWLYIKIETPCERNLRMPFLIMGGALLGVSMLGLLGSCCRLNFFMWLYLITLFVLMLGLTVFTIFVIIVTNKEVGRELSGKGLGERKLGDYSHWLQNYVVNAENWDKIRVCFGQIKLCSFEAGKDHNHYSKYMASMQSSCCKPPSVCGLVFVNSTTWNMPAKGPADPNPDCTTWSNEQTELCYNCESCKVEALEEIKKEWKILSLANTCILLLVGIIYSISCCALRNNQSQGYQKYKDYAKYA